MSRYFLYSYVGSPTYNNKFIHRDTVGPMLYHTGNLATIPAS